MSTTVTGWASGELCERHEMAYCSGCRDLAGIARKADGSLGYKGDCTILTFAEITNASYDEAFDVMKAHGYIIGRGTPEDKIRTAFESAGFTVISTPMSLDMAFNASKNGRNFYVIGAKGRKSHAWSISNGTSRRAYQPPFRYRVFEVK